MNTHMIEAYNKVFDEHGNVRACGRQACITLIKLFNELDAVTDFGNIRTGQMNIANIKAAYQQYQTADEMPEEDSQRD